MAGSSVRDTTMSRKENKQATKNPVVADRSSAAEENGHDFWWASFDRRIEIAASEQEESVEAASEPEAILGAWGTMAKVCKREDKFVTRRAYWDELGNEFVVVEDVLRVGKAR